MECSTHRVRSDEPTYAQVVELQVLLGAALERIRELEQEKARSEEEKARSEEENKRLKQENERIREQLAKALEQLAKALEQVRRNSTNSSMPPSQDKPGTIRPVKKQSSGLRPGGQPGHPKYERPLVPPEKVSKLIELVPEQCQTCQGPLKGRDSAPARHQVVELPAVVASVTEYQCHELECPSCGARTRAQLPPEARSAFGERLGALVSLLVGKYRLSKRLVCEALSEIMDVEVSLGSVSNLEQQMSQALEAPVAEAEQYVREADVVHMDETGWYEGVSKGRAARAWMWVVATTLVVVFRIAPSRGSQVAKELLGEDFIGWLISDRWSAYSWYDKGLRQLCWAHLTRDFQSFIDRGGEGARIGKELMAERNRMFKWWRRVKEGTLSREQFQRRMRKVERTVGQLLREAAEHAEPKTAGMAKEILKLEQCLWVFVDVPGVEPTNNFGERSLRGSVIYRKISFGTRSAKGSRFIERILSSTTTLRLQERNVLEWLTQALGAFRRGLPAPSLLPLAIEAHDTS